MVGGLVTGQRAGRLSPASGALQGDGVLRVGAMGALVAGALDAEGEAGAGGHGKAVAEAVIAAAVSQAQPEVGGADARGAEQRQSVGGLGGDPRAGVGAGGVRGQAGDGGPAVKRVRAAGRGPTQAGSGS